MNFLALASLCPSLFALWIPLAVRVANLTKKFGQLAVQDVTFEAPRGSIFGFIGPSGCGKTTTVRLMSGLYTPTSGDVIVFGRRPIDFTSETRAKIGYMPLCPLSRSQHLGEYELCRFVIRHDSATSQASSSVASFLEAISPIVRTISWMLPATYAILLLQDIMLRGNTGHPQLLLGLLPAPYTSWLGFSCNAQWRVNKKSW